MADGNSTSKARIRWEYLGVGIAFLFVALIRVDARVAMGSMAWVPLSAFAMDAWDRWQGDTERTP